MAKALIWELVEWEFNPSYGKAWRAKVGRGYLWLNTHARDRCPRIWNGISYVSSFGPNSDKSFSGFLPDMTMDQAKEAVLAEAQKHW